MPINYKIGQWLKHRTSGDLFEIKKISNSKYGVFITLQKTFDGECKDYYEQWYTHTLHDSTVKEVYEHDFILEIFFKK